MQPSYPSRGRGLHRQNFQGNEDYELAAGVNEAKNQFFESLLNRKLYANAKDIFEVAPS